jgi:hypothetical protein
MFFWFFLSINPYSYVRTWKIEIILGKTDKFDELMAAASEEREAAEAEEQSWWEGPCCSLSYCSAARFILFLICESARDKCMKYYQLRVQF